MKRKSMITMLVIALMLLLSLTVLSACGKKMYQLTVTGGTGGGEYSAGTVITITADTPETGKKFTGWTLDGVSVDDKTEAELTFTMPESNVTATANYEYIDYAVTVTGGTANKTTAHYGDTVKITAATPQTGKEFTGWTINGVTVDDKTKAEITFTMPANAVTATANYGDKAYLFALENCTADKETAKFGEQVTFTADEIIGKRFDSWNIKGVDDLTGLDLTKSPLTITMPANDINVAAVLEDIDYTVSVTGGTTDKETAHYGDTVTITANAPATGKEFTGWTLNGVTVENTSVDELTFTMPAGNVTATANYDFIDYTVTVNGGTAQVDADAEPTSEAFATYECPVSIFATAPTGQRFVRWTSADGVVFDDETSEETTFTMPDKDVTVTAVFEYIDYTVSVTGGTAYTDGEPAGSITAEYGDFINIVAEVSTGKRFVKWTSDSADVVFDSETSETTSFEMPAGDITVTAVFEYIDYTVTVVGGTAYTDGDPAESIMAEYGDFINIVAEVPTGKRFVKWTSDSADVVFDSETSDATSFEMPAKAVTVTAVFEYIDYEIKVTGGAAQVNDGGPFSTNAAHYGDNVKIKAHNPGTGMEFKNWTITGVDTSELVLTNEELTFTMPANAVTATANYDFINYTVSVTGGTANKTTAHYGEEVTITAEVPVGKEFVMWSFDGLVPDGLTLTDKELTFTMPANDVTATAELRDLVKRSVTVQGGVAQVGDGTLATSLEAYCGDTVTLTAYQKEDKTFVKWTIEGIDDTTGLDLTQRVLTFTMPDNDVSATAEFENVPTNLTFDGNVATSGELRYVNYDSKSFRLPLGSGQDLCTYTIELSNSAFTFKVYGSDGEVVPYDNGDGVMCIDINRDDNYTIEVINTGTAANCTLTVTKV